MSTDVGAFEQIIQALHRLMDLKEKYLDVEVCMSVSYRRMRSDFPITKNKIVGDNS